MTETRRPCPSRCGITFDSKVVLPAPLQPDRPITFIHTLRAPLSPSLRGAKRRSNPVFSCGSGLLRGACHRAGIRPTRWLAMTVLATFVNPLKCLYRPDLLVMLTCRHDEDRRNPEHPGRAARRR